MIVTDALAIYTSVNPREVSAGREAFEFLSGDLVDDSLQELITLSLFTWRRSLDADPVPVGASREGWFADADFGSRLYLLQRAKLTNQALVDARQYAEEALAWMVTEGILTRVTALATRRADGRGIELEIATTSPRGNDAAVRFAYLTGS